jgi:hypothetical protein
LAFQVHPGWPDHWAVSEKTPSARGRNLLGAAGKRRPLTLVVATKPSGWLFFSFCCGGHPEAHLRIAVLWFGTPVSHGYHEQNTSYRPSK